MEDERLAKMGVVSAKAAARQDGTFSIVLLPASGSAPPKELVLKLPAAATITTTTTTATSWFGKDTSNNNNNSNNNNEHPTLRDDSFLDELLGPYFELREGESVDMDLLETQAQADYRCTDYVCPHVSPAILKMAAEAGTLQKAKIQLSLDGKDDSDGDSDGDDDDNVEKSRGIGTSSSRTELAACDIICRMYYDESASFKGREENRRANAYLRQTTTKTDNDDVIFGDVFLVNLENNRPASMRPVDLRGLACETLEAAAT